MFKYRIYLYKTKATPKKQMVKSYLRILKWEKKLNQKLLLSLLNNRATGFKKVQQDGIIHLIKQEN